MKEMWDKRYSEKDYAYGLNPNEFFKETLDSLSVRGKLLLPAEGEGRNAVYAAKKGFEVTAFDISLEGKRKASLLAEREGVEIDYQVGDFFKLPLTNEKFDFAGLIYAHFPPPLLKTYHQKISDLLNPGGMIILEGFSLANLELRRMNPKVGGPDKPEMLFTTESIKKDFLGFDILTLEEVQIDLHEGIYHNGKAKVIRFVGKKML